jgi:hypothetical protein
MLNSRHLVAAALGAALSCGLPAGAGDLAAAKRYVDQSSPLNCELIALQIRGRSLEPESPEYRALSDEFYRKVRRAEQELAAETKRYQEVDAELTGEERAEVGRYSMALAEACVKKTREAKDFKVGPPPGGPTTVVPESPGVKATRVAP